MYCSHRTDLTTSLSRAHIGRMFTTVEPHRRQATHNLTSAFTKLRTCSGFSNKGLFHWTSNALCCGCLTVMPMEQTACRNAELLSLRPAGVLIHIYFHRTCGRCLLYQSRRSLLFHLHKPLFARDCWNTGQSREAFVAWGHSRGNSYIHWYTVQRWLVNTSAVAISQI